MLIAEEMETLKAKRDPYIRIIALAQRFALRFGKIERYDLEVILGSLHQMLFEHDSLIALKDGIWIPRLCPMPPSVKKKRLSVSAPYYRKNCQAAWVKLIDQILRSPQMLDEPEYNPAYSTELAPRSWLALRFAILKRDKYRCCLCGIAAQDSHTVRLEVDHKRARSKGGTDDQSNLWTLCFACNRGKGTQAL